MQQEAPVIKLQIGGRALDSGTGGTFDHRNPYDGTVQATVPLAGKVEIDEAVELAYSKAEEWRRWEPEARRDVLLRLGALLEANKDELARLAALDGGTPLVFGHVIVDMAVNYFKYYGGWCDKLSGELISTFDTRGVLTYTVPEPYGVVGIIITWNGPLGSLGMKVAAALAAGNCVVVKPSELTPFVPSLFAQLVCEAGVPEGVCTVLNGSREAGEALVRHPKVPLVSFTGGPATARSILMSCAEQMKPSIMELGGKSPSVIFADVEDLEAVCQSAVRMSIGSLSGQGCAIPSRLVVEASVYDQVVDRVTAIAGSYKLGDPMEAGVLVGPLINHDAVERVVGMLDRARADGAGRFTVGGGRPGGNLAGKNFVEPTIIADADPDHEISQTEIFGPVVVLTRFSTEDEAVAIANNTAYGLAAFLCSGNVERTHRMAERLHAGTVYVNNDVLMPSAHTPFGGLGMSGYGKEGGRAGIDGFLRYKTVEVR